MSSVVAIVKSIVGQVVAVSPEGVRRVLIEGDRLFAGDQVDTGLAGAVSLELQDGRTIDLGRDTQWSANTPDSAVNLQEAAAQNAPSVAELQQAIAAGADPTKDLEATAAGPTAAGAAGDGGGSHSFVVLDATAGRVDPTIGFPTDGLGNTGANANQLAAGTTTTATNSPSVLNADTATLAEDSVATGNVLSNDSDADTALTVASFTVAGVSGTFAAGQTATITGVGTLVIGSNGDYTFTPDANYNGAVPQVTYTTNTGSTSTLDITVTAVDDPSVLVADRATVAEDTAATGNVLSNDSDVDNVLSVATFTVSGVNGTFSAGQTATIDGVGSLTIAANGDYTFTPDANYNGTVPTASYTTNTGSTSTLDISVTPVDDSFTDTSENVSSAEDTVATGSVLTGTSSVDSPVSVVSFTIGDTTYTAGTTATITGVGTLVIGSNGEYTFTPVANYNGEVPTVSYTVTDGSGSDVTSTLNINVTPVDDSFTDASENISLAEDTVATGSVLTGTSSVDGPVSVVNFTIGDTTYAAGTTATISGVGTLVIGSNGEYTFTPVANYNGEVPTVSYTVTDGSGSDVTSTLNINVTPVDDSFTDASETISSAEDTVATGSVLTGTSSVDGPVSVVNFTIGDTTYTAGTTATISGVGTLVIGSNGEYTFTPVANYNGEVPTVSYTVTDGSGSDVTSTLNINVTPVDDSFTDASEIVSSAEDTVATGSVLTGTSSVDGPVSVVSFTIGDTTYTAGTTATIANVGTLVIGSNGDYTFTPVANYNGEVPTVSYTVTDGSGSDVTSTLNINVTPVDDSFTDASEIVSSAEDTVATGSVLTGTSSVDGPVSVVSFTIGDTTYTAGTTATISGVGTLVIGSNGEYTFTPVANYNGEVPTVSYTVTDGSGSDVTSTLNINVTPVDDSFTDVSENISLAEDTVATGSVLTGTSSVDGPVSVVNFTIGDTTYTAGTTATIANVGTLVIGSNGEYTFTPVANYNGEVPTISYTVTDGSGSDVTSTLNINVTPVDDSFTDASETISSAEDTVATGSVLTGTSSVDGPVSVVNFTIGDTTYTAGTTATISGVGTLVIGSNGDYTFTPVANYNGEVPTVSYTVTDGSGSDVTSTLNINVTPVDDSFTDASEIVSSAEDTVATGSVLTGTSSVDGPVSVVSFTIGDTTYTAGTTATIANVGTLVIGSNGEYTFTPVANYNGEVPTVSYTVTDGSGSDVTSTLNINVTPVDDSFTDASEIVSSPEDSVATGSVLTGTSSVDGPVSVVNFTIGETTYTAGTTATIANVGTLVIGSNGEYTFTPVANYNGEVPTVSYTVTDGSGSDVTSTLNINVTPVDDSFTDANEIVSSAEDTIATGSVLTSTSSVDGPVSVVNFTIGDTTYTAGTTATITNVGTLVIGSNGDYTFTPVANYNGEVPTVSYTVTDGSGSDVTSTLNINVTPVDDSFTDASEIVSSAEDTIATGSVLTGTSSVDGPVSVVNFTIGDTTYTAGTTATITGVGTLVIGSNGDYTFTPVANYNGEVPTVSYTVTDGSGSDVTSTLNINVTPVDDSFTDASEIVSSAEDTVATGSVLTGTSSVDGPVSVVNFTIGDTTYTAGTTATITGVGTLVIGSNGDYTFTPVANYNGEVPTVSYTVTDGSGSDVTSTLNINVTPVDDSFTDASEIVSSAEDTIATGSVLTGTSSVDGPVSVVNFTIGDTTYTAGTTATITGVGTLVIGSNGDYTFTPVANYNGEVPTVSYTVTDGSGSDVTSTLNINVTPVDDSFTDASEIVSSAEDTVATGSVLTGTSSVDGPVSVVNFTIGDTTYTAGTTATITGVGTLVIGSNGDYTFTPVANYNGEVPTVSYTVTDGSGSDVTSTLNINVTPVDDSFTDASEIVSSAEDTIATGSVLTGTSSVDGPVSVVNFTIGDTTYTAGTTATITNVGTLVIGSNGEYTFTPVANYNGEVPTVSYTVTDGSGSDVISTLNINVTPVDDSFTDASEIVSSAEDTVATGSVLTGTSSVDGPVSVVSFTIGDTTYTAGTTATITNIGTLVIGSNGDYTFTPVANWNGTVPTVSYTLTDGSGENVTSTLNITVTPVDDNFTDASERVTIDEDHSAVGNVLTGTSSVDGPVSVVDFTVGGITYKAGETASNATIGSVTIAADGSYTFIPTANWNGSVPTITYTVTDGSGSDVKSTLSITVTPVDDPSVLQADLKTIAEDHLAYGNVLSNDSDVDNALKVATFTIDGVNGTFKAGQPVVIAGVGIVVLESNGTYLFAPKPDWNGSVPTISYTTNTGSTSTLNITVTPVDDSFTDRSEKVTVLEDHNAIGNVLEGTHSVDGPVSVVDFTVGGVTYKAGETASDATIGSVTIAADGSYTFTPVANWNGTVPTITYTVTDGSGSDVKSTLSISVTPVDDSFTDRSETITIDEDTVAKGSVLDGTSSVDGPVSVVDFTVAGVTYKAGETASNATIGSLTIAADGSYTFTPTANWNGTVPTVTYTVTDGSGSDVKSTLNITVTPVDDSFTDRSETVTIDEDTVAKGSVLDGTSSVDGPVSVVDFTVAGVTYKAGETASNATIGSLTIAADGSYTFTPTANWNGTVPTVTYTVTDGSGSDVKSTLNISVTPVDDSFTDRSETVTIDEDTVAKGSVLDGTSSVDGPVSVVDFTVGGVTYKAGETVTNTTIGSLTIAADGSYTFTPVANWNGTVPTITYTVTDGSGSDVKSTLNISVAPVDDSFTDASEKVTIDEDHAAVGNVLTGTSSVDGPVSVVDFTVGGVTYKAGETASNATVGSLTIAADGSYTFVPAANWNGTVPTISYTVTDGSGTDVKSTLSITVTPVDDPSVLQADLKTIAEDHLAIGNVLSNDSDVDNVLKVASFTIDGVNGTFKAGQPVVIAGVGILVLGSDGTYLFAPKPDWNGSVPTVHYTTNTGSTSTLSITVTPVDDSFTDRSENVTVLEDHNAIGNVLDGTHSVDGPVSVVDFTVGGVTYKAGETAADATIGSVTIAADGSYTFTPAADWNGTVPTISYTVTDGSGSDVTSTLNINVTPVDDSFTDASEIVSSAEDTIVTGSVLTGTSSVDGPVSVVNFTIGDTTYTAGTTATITGVGTLVIGSNGEYTFTPVANYNGEVPTVSYTVTDGSGSDVTSTLNINVTPVDDSFTDASETISSAEDTVATGSVLTGTSSVDGPVSVVNFTIGDTTYTAGTTATITGVGTLVIGSNGDYTFTPVANYNGEVPTVSYTVTDGSGSDVTSTLNINVTPVDDSFTDASETISSAEDTVATGSVLTGTSSVDGPVSVVNFTIGDTTYTAGTTATITGVGTLVIGSNGEYTFTPVANYNGEVPTVSYTVTDGSGSDVTSTLNINVTPVDDSFTDASETISSAEDTVATGSVLTGTSSVDGPVSVVNFTIGDTTYTAGTTATITGVGTLVIGSNGDYTFTPVANYNGEVPTVSYTVTDGSGSDVTSTLNINVTPVDDSFTDASENISSAEDTIATGSVLTGTSSVDGPVSVVNFTIGDTTYTAGTTATITGVGTLVIGSNGDYTFTPVANYNGEVPTVSYTVTDGSGSDVTSTLNINVTPVDDSFTDASETISSAEDTVATGSVLTGTSSVDGPVSVVNFTIGDTTYTAGTTATITGVGTLVIGSNGEYTFTPVANYNGEVPTVSYTVTDGSGSDVTSTLNINVTPVDDSFTDASEIVSSAEDTIATGSVLTGTSSVDGPVSVVNFTIGDTTYAAGTTATISGVGTLVIGSNGEYTFTPVANYNGEVPTVSYTVTDGSGSDVTSTLNINVTPVDDSFTDASEIVSSAEDTIATGSVLTGTSSVDGPVSVVNFTIGDTTYTAGTTATIANVGTLVIGSNGEYTFTPVANYNGEVPTVSYTVTDGSGSDVTSTLNINVTPVDDSFTDASEIVSSAEDTIATGSVLTGTSSVDGPVSVVNFTIGDTTYTAGTTATITGVGTLVIGSNGEYTFTPVANYNGEVPTVSYTVTDGSGSDVTSTLNINVTPVDDSFTDASEIVSSAEDTVATGSVLTGTSSVDGPVSVVNFTIGDTTYTAGTTATIANVGTLVIGSNGEYTFTPVANYNGEVPTVSYTVTDGSGSDVTSTLNINVTPVDDSFTDAYEIIASAEDTIATGSVLTGTSSVDGPVSVVNFTIGDTTYTAGTTATITGVGTLVIGSNGDYTFTPVANYNGEVPTVSYTVTDGSGSDVTSTLNINVTPVDDSFTDASETISSAEDTVATGSVLTGTSSVDGPVSVVNFTIGDTTYTAGTTATITGVGTLVIGSNGEYTFTPVANYNGEVPTVSYTVTDGSGSDVTSTLNINVTPVDDSFTDASEIVSSAEDTVATGSVLTGTSSVDGPVSVVNFTIGDTTYTAGTTATITGVGTLVIGSNGDYTFTPVANYNGEVPTVSYTVTDGSGSDVTSTLNINVTPVDDSFTDASEIVSSAEDTIATGSVLTGTSSVDGPVSVVNFTIGDTTYTAGTTATITNVGTLVIGSNGEYTFTPVANYNGEVPTVSYTVTDGSGSDVTSTLNINVTPVDDSFTDASETISIAEDTVATGSILTGTSSVDGPVSVVSFTIGDTTYAAGATATIAKVGTLVIGSNGDYTFTPVKDWNGTVPTVSYTVTDGSGSDVKSTLNINVTAVDDPSVLQADTNTVDEDHTATGNVLSNDLDVDNVLAVTKYSVSGVSGSTDAGQPVTIAGVGTLTIAANGDYTFTPVKDWNGSVPIVTYTTNTGSTSTLAITVNSVNDAPLVNITQASGDEDHTIAVTLGGSDVDGTIDHFTLATLPANGVFYADAAGHIQLTTSSVISATANGATVYFKPTGDYSGTTSFTYTSTDNQGLTSATSATGTIVVNPVSDTPSLTLTGGGTVASTDLQEVTVANVSNVDVSKLGNGVWHTDNSGGTVEIGKGSVYGTGTNSQVIELERNSGDPSNLYTNISAKAGTTYTVAFDYAPRVGALDNSVINVYWGGQLIATLNTTTAGMQHYSFDVPVTTDGTQKLEFRAVDDNSLGGLLDNINVTQVLNSGLEDNAILLSTINAHSTDVDGSETLAVTLSGLPAGSTLTDGTHTFNATAGSTTADITTWNLSALKLTPPSNFNGDISLTVTATATDGTATPASTSLPLTVHVAAVDDPSVLKADTGSANEDHNATGNVLTNDVDVDNVLSVATFSVNGSTVNAGQTATISGVGTLTIAANGDYTFTPVKDWSGTVPTVSYTTNTGSTSTLGINIVAVADQPSVVATTPTYASTGLAEQTWAPSTALYNALGTGGNGASAATLIAGINGYKVAPTTSTTVSDFYSSNVVQGTATKATGLIYLEAGKTYTFGGTADDSLAVTVGGTTVASATWGNQSGKISGDGFTPTVSGYYTLDIYHFNQNGPGNYNLTVSVNGGTATSLSTSNLSTYTTVDDIAKAGLTVSDLHGLNGEGYYTVASINHGQENTFIKISPITATYTDNDGSETHVTTLSGIPVNSVLTDGTGKTLVVSSTAAINLAGWDTQTLSIKPPTDFTGTLNLTVTATATETSNNSTASDVAHIAVTVDAVNLAPVVANSLVKGTEGTQLTLTWDSLHVTDNDSAASKLSIIVTQLPDAAAGKLMYNDGTGWKDVTVGMVISKAVIDANGLAFVPVAHQSGGADYTAAGLGDQKADYAQFKIQGYDGADKSAVATVTVDIAPVVDAPIVSASNTQVVENNTVALGLTVTSLDTDGSETQTITKIGGIPVGATLTDGTHTFTATSSQSEVSLSGWDVSKLSYTPAPYTHGTDTLTVTAVSTENHTTQSLTTTTALNITVTAGVYDHQVGNAGTDTTPINGAASNDILIGDTNGTEIVAGKNYNIAFILDSSGSMQSSLAAAVAQLKTVFAQLSDTANGTKAGTVNVYLLDFDTNAGKSVSVDLSDKDALTKLTALLDSIKADGVTNYEDAFKTAANWFHTDTATNNTGATNLTFFITDGQPNYYQDTAATVIDYRTGTDKVLSDYIAQWKSGTALTVTLADGKHTLISATGVVYDLVENRNGTFSSQSIGTLTAHADGYGGTEYSLTTGSSSNTPTTASISNATEGYTALSAVSTVEAIGLNNGINKTTLQLFDTDHVVKIGVDANDLAATIKSSTTSIAPGDDIINGGDGNDILFGDIVNLGGSTNGIQALQAYVASKSGISDSTTVTDQQLHQYITNHVSEFNLSSTAGGSDTLSGGNGNDILFGQAGDDKLDGGAGNDILVGGRGDDILTGGSGADTFVWLKGDTGKDTITDFKVGEGDKIDLGDLLQGENENNIDSYLKITTTDGVSTLQVSSTGKLNDAGGVANADVTIKLTGNDWSHTSVSSLIAGSDPTIKVDHSH